MKQVVFVHGGESFDTYDEYLAWLKAAEYDPFKVREKKWREWIAESLGEDWQAFMPSMPSPVNAKYLEWSIWFDKVVPHLTDGVVLIGHSLGGIFLAKYLSERDLPFAPAAVFLVAAPFGPVEGEYTLADFTLPEDLSKLARQAGKLYLYHSKDDDVVPFEALENYQRLLPEATVRVFEDRGHFLGPEFPELLEDIRSLA